MKKAVVGILNRVPVVLIVIGEALVIYLATAVAKLAFTQLDPLYSVWYRVGFMAVLLLLWRMRVPPTLVSCGAGASFRHST